MRCRACGVEADDGQHWRCVPAKPFTGMVGRIKLTGRVVDGRWVETVEHLPDIDTPEKK